MDNQMDMCMQGRGKTAYLFLFLWRYANGIFKDFNSSFDKKRHMKLSTDFWVSLPVFDKKIFPVWL